MTGSMPELLKSLLDTVSPAGCEGETREVFAAALRKAARVTDDRFGNTLAVLNPGAPFRVVLAAHADEVGFQAVHVEENGFVFLRRSGGPDLQTLPGTPITFLHEGRHVHGCCCKLAAALQSDEQKQKTPDFEHVWADIGAASREEALARISIGDYGAVRPNAEMLSANRIVSKALDDKIGLYVITETLLRLKAAGCPAEVTAAATAQEELGSRGAKALAEAVTPDLALTVDVCQSTDVPDSPLRRCGLIRLGGGPALTRNGDNSERLAAPLRKFAARHRIPYQENVYKSTGGTDAAVLSLGAGVESLLVSVPLRCMHTPQEVCDLNDAENAVRLLTGWIMEFAGPVRKTRRK